MEAEQVIGNDLPGSDLVFVIEHEHNPQEVNETNEIHDGCQTHADAS